MEVKKIVEGMTAPQVAQVIDDNFKAQNAILEEDIAKQNSVIGVSEYEDFSETEAVNVGDVRKYNGFLYECVEATTGAFDASKWKKSSFKAETEKKLSELGSEAVGFGVQSKVSNIIFEDKENDSVDVTFKGNVYIFNSRHELFNLTFGSYPQTFNVPEYKTLCFNLETKEVSVQDFIDGAVVKNNIVLLHKEPKTVNSGVLASLYNSRNTEKKLSENIESLNNYKGIDVGGSAISPLSSISIEKDGEKVIVKMSARNYYVIDDFVNTTVFTIAEDAEFIIPSYGVLAANIKNKSIEVSKDYYKRDGKCVLLAYQEGGVIQNGLLKGLYDNTFATKPLINERDFTDLTYTKKVDKKWVDAENIETSDSNFNLYYFNIEGSTKVQLYNATGGGYTILLDAENKVLSTYQSNPLYTSSWAELDVPESAVLLKVTHAILNERHPYSYPLKVRADRVGVKSRNEGLEPLRGKKVVFFGDSITAMGYYVDAFQSLTGCITVNRGVSGSSIANSESSGRTDALSLRVDYEPSDAVGYALGLPENADLVIFLAGVNDWGQRNIWNIELGSMEAEVDKTNFTGATKYVFSRLREKYPRTPIVALSMLHTYHPTSFAKWAEISYADGQYGGGITYATDKEGNTMDIWRKRVGEVAKFYGIPFVDMTQCGFTPFLQTDNEAFMPDGLHPSEEGGAIMAKYILAQIKSLGAEA